MSLVDIIPGIKTYYTTVEDDVINEFYKPCMLQSKIYYRGVGYFRSSVFKLMNEELIRFCLNGGKMTILTSTDIDPGDHQAAMEGYNLQSFYKTIEEMLEDSNLNNSTKLLCAMVATGHLEIKVAVVPKGGIYHDKVGFFEDEEGNIISFHGSGNETYNALVGERGNIETYNVIWNWDESYSIHGIKWENGLRKTIRGDFKEKMQILDLSEIDVNLLNKYEISLNLEDYIDDEESLTSLIPELREHQKEGLRKWRENNSRGVLKHATASGKTITSISAIEKHLISGDNVIILVPTRILLRQWEEEVEKYLSNLNPIIGKIGDGEKDDQILNMMRWETLQPMVFISTIRSAKDSKILKKILESENLNILLVIDECHNIGSSGCAEFCKIKTGPSLGLSATPERWGDPEGTERLFNLLGPIVHKFSLKDAMENKPSLLTPYEYHMTTITLTSEEQDRYDELKIKISRLYAIWLSSKEPNKSDIKSKLDICNFEARRIIRGASGKLDKAIELIEKNYDKDQHWLIYCDTLPMLDKIEYNIRKIGIVPQIYHSKMNDFNKKKALQSFERNGGLLLAMKCLDEGVNIPCISHGMVLSSTTNPREFIQRRGRMLRKFPGKTISHIFDTFALPNKSGENIGFLFQEILRAKELAEDSENKMTSVIRLNSIIRSYGITSIPELEAEVVYSD